MYCIQNLCPRVCIYCACYTFYYAAVYTPRSIIDTHTHTHFEEEKLSRESREDRKIHRKIVRHLSPFNHATRVRSPPHTRPADRLLGFELNNISSSPPPMQRPVRVAEVQNHTHANIVSERHFYFRREHAGPGRCAVVHTVRAVVTGSNSPRRPDKLFHNICSTKESRRHANELFRRSTKHNLNNM